MTDIDQARLSAHLAEYARLSGENHTTFQRQQQQLQLMITLALASLGYLFSSKDVVTNWPELILIVPIPLFFMTIIHLRDDLKLHSIDEYVWRVIRKRIMIITNSNDDEIWNWLQVADRLKFGSNFRIGVVYFILSLCRYLFPFIIIIVCLIGYAYVVYRTQLSAVGIGLFILNLLGLISVFPGGLWLVKKSGNYIVENSEGWITKGMNLKP
jgi:hypothetical protein